MATKRDTGHVDLEIVEAASVQGSAVRDYMLATWIGISCAATCVASKCLSAMAWIASMCQKSGVSGGLVTRLTAQLITQDSIGIR